MIEDNNPKKQYIIYGLASALNSTCIGSSAIKKAASNPTLELLKRSRVKINTSTITPNPNITESILTANTPYPNQEVQK